MRAKSLVISRHMLGVLLKAQPGDAMIVVTGNFLPDDAEITHAELYHETGDLKLIVHSREYPEVPSGNIMGCAKEPTLALVCPPTPLTFLPPKGKVAK